MRRQGDTSTPIIDLEEDQEYDNKRRKTGASNDDTDKSKKHPRTDDTLSEVEEASGVGNPRNVLVSKLLQADQIVKRRSIPTVQEQKKEQRKQKKEQDRLNKLEYEKDSTSRFLSGITQQIVASKKKLNAQEQMQQKQGEERARTRSKSLIENQQKANERGYVKKVSQKQQTKK